MWQDDTVLLQEVTEVNTKGSIKQTWISGVAVLCDVQDISREYVYKEFGFNEYTEYKQVFDHTGASWKKGNQVSFEGKQWLVRKVDNLEKIGASNHKYIILSALGEDSLVWILEEGAWNDEGIWIDTSTWNDGV